MAPKGRGSEAWVDRPAGDLGFPGPRPTRGAYPSAALARGEGGGGRGSPHLGVCRGSASGPGAGGGEGGTPLPGRPGSGDVGAIRAAGDSPAATPPAGSTALLPSRHVYGRRVYLSIQFCSLCLLTEITSSSNALRTSFTILLLPSSIKNKIIDMGSFCIEAYEREISNDSYVSGFNNWENGASW
nr:polyadenylate-binding protein, cytoplasmic and nuclear-like [Globicephala melas]